MSRVSDLLDALAEMDERPDTMLDDLRQAHDMDLADKDTEIEGMRTAAIEGEANTSAALAARDAEIQSLKAKNYEMLAAVPANPNSGGGVNDEPSGDVETVEKSPENVTYDDLFTERD